VHLTNSQLSFGQITKLQLTTSHLSTDKALAIAISVRPHAEVAEAATARSDARAGVLTRELTAANAVGRCRLNLGWRIRIPGSRHPPESPESDPRPNPSESGIPNR
jgi:hypothetical protein